MAEREPGSVGTLNCGENIDTLARFALLAQGERIHVANFPSAAPFHDVVGHYNGFDVLRLEIDRTPGGPLTER